MKLILLSLLVLTIAFGESKEIKTNKQSTINFYIFNPVDSAFVPTVPGLSDDDLFNEDDCRQNESFRECGHSAMCDWTCENRNEPYITCPPICVRRCICDAGYVRTGNGECIDENECPSSGNNYQVGRNCSNTIFNYFKFQ